MRPLFYLLFVITETGVAETVRNEKTVVVALGQDASLKCALTTREKVLQVTWQKKVHGADQNMASYNQAFGARIIDAFQEHVQFQEMGLNESLIVIKNVSWGDETCYKCLFNAYPRGAITGQTCLKISELYKPELDFGPTRRSKDHLTYEVSCSVTGKPVPEVSWTVKEDVFLENSTTTHTVHRNGTTTVIKTATVQFKRTHYDSKDVSVVKCVASQPTRGNRKEVCVARFPYQYEDSNSTVAVIWVAATVGLGLLLVLLYCAYKITQGRNMPQLKDAEKCGRTPQRDRCSPMLLEAKGYNSSLKKRMVKPDPCYSVSSKRSLSPEFDAL